MFCLLFYSDYFFWIDRYRWIKHIALTNQTIIHNGCFNISVPELTTDYS